MRRNYKIIIPIVLLTIGLVSFRISNQPDPDKDKHILSALRFILSEGHFSPAEIDDTFSEGVYTSFLEVLDPAKHYFIQPDIDEFSAQKHLIDEQIDKSDLTFFYMVYDRFQQRVDETEHYYKEILSKPMDVDKEETFSVDYENKDFAKDKNELLKVWEKQLKIRYLSSLYDKEKTNEEKLKSDSTYVSKSFETLEKEAFEKTKENMDNLYDRMEELDREDWFAYFINSITAQFGPHTSYLAPKIKKKFDMSMSGKLEGIGARLQKDGEYTKVVELISGGPAWRAGELKVGDLILEVAQGDKEPLDIVGMRLDDAIEFIKGKKGTEVRLTLKRVEGIIETISIIRDVVELEETFVKSSIIEKDGKKYGLIHLPKFYIDFDHQNDRNSTTDMVQEIERLKAENVEGIAIDLRDNGGGSLKTAIEIGGLFIDRGPIVQVKYRDEKAKVRGDDEPGLHWEGPLVVLVNELSASASEIFAAAMQDYNRAIILGGKQTFGKGTVQNFYPLNQYVHSDDELGFLKMTIQKFYRINGGSTQLEGVKPDIIVPSRYSYMDIGEKDEKKPLQWDKIKPAKYKVWKGYSNYQSVIKNSRSRVFDNAQFKLIDENAKWLKNGQEDTTVYLNYEAFKEDIDSSEKENEKFDSIDDYQNTLIVNSPNYEVLLTETDSILAKKRSIWHTNITEDVYIDEAINILGELHLKRNHKLVKN